MTGGTNEPVDIVLLARVDTPEAAGYRAYGLTECVRCGHRVQLGSASWAKVAAGTFQPVCLVCGVALGELLSLEGCWRGNVEDEP